MDLQEHSNVIVNENFRNSGVKLVGQVHPDVISIKNSTEKSSANGSINGLTKVKKKSDARESQETSYLETLMHLFKGNVGPGCFAMADAMKNGGLILAPVLTLFLGAICVHAQHVLLNCSAAIQEKLDLKTKPDYAETVELCFSTSSNETCRQLAPAMKRICNIFICITQLGFCSIYFLFIGTNLKQVLDFYGLNLDIHLLIPIVLVPIWLSSLITNLKYLAPCSAVANFCMVTGLIISYYYSAQNLPHFTERNLLPTNLHRLPLFFGTAIFAFEGIALVLPLQSAMKNSRNFSKMCGVLNVGMVLVTGIFISFGTIGYWKYGEATEASLTLNLPTDQILAQSVKLAIALGVLLGYAIQFFVAIQIMLPCIERTFAIAEEHLFLGEILFRTLMVLVTFGVAELVPNLSLLLSLIGAVCSTVLALVFPPILEFIILSCEPKGINWIVLLKNTIILFLALIGFLTGGYESVSSIVKTFF